MDKDAIILLPFSSSRSSCQIYHKQIRFAVIRRREEELKTRHKLFCYASLLSFFLPTFFDGHNSSSWSSLSLNKHTPPLMLLLLPGRGVLVVHTDCRVHGDPRAEITEAAKKWRHYSSATADEAPPVLPSHSFSIHRMSLTYIDDHRQEEEE